jgi:hypothetical protein
MKLSGLHLLLTYQCTFECEHCFVWGSPFQVGTMHLKDIRSILQQAENLGSVTSIYFEGGEPFLYYPVLLRGVELAYEKGFQVGIVSNAFWATSFEEAILWLQPFAGKIQDLTVSSDQFHYSEKLSQQAIFATKAAEKLGIPTGVITIETPELSNKSPASGQLPEGESGVMYRGRAAARLAERVPQHAWDTFNSCPFENLADPGRVHVDPLGFLHLCQGINLGNMFVTPLTELVENFRPLEHPIVGPLLEGGPRMLVERYGLSHADEYADACHLCYNARLALRPEFPAVLAPDQVYGVY